MSDTQRTWMMDVGKQVVSFIVGVVVAAFVLGRGIQKINAVAEWKAEVAPKIERMDSVGSLSFEHWKLAHDKESDRYKQAHEKEHALAADRIKTLEIEMREIQRRIPDR